MNRVNDTFLKKGRSYVFLIGVNERRLGRADYPLPSLKKTEKLCMKELLALFSLILVSPLPPSMSSPQSRLTICAHSFLSSFELVENTAVVLFTSNTLIDLIRITVYLQRRFDEYDSTPPRDNNSNLINEKQS